MVSGCMVRTIEAIVTTLSSLGLSYVLVNAGFLRVLSPAVATRNGRTDV